MNNPFDYEPSIQMLEAQKHLIAHIESLCKADSAFEEEVEKGKMFGILRVNGGNILYAFSGQICGSFIHAGFVPPVFDYLDETGHFKLHEREISEINHKISALESSLELQSLQEDFTTKKREGETDIDNYRLMMKAAKVERDLIRGKGLTDNATLVKESQFMKAELHRKKLFWKGQLEETEAKINGFIGEIRSLKLQRQKKSDALQRWLFEQFIFTNPHNREEKKNLLEIFETYNREHNLLRNAPQERLIPPSGAGECCEPKLLHYAIEHSLEPVEIGMFWWGGSPKQEVRHHLQFYPACNGKCKPILEMLLKGSCPASFEEEAKIESDTLQEIYSDQYLVVVNKLAGMLSVPGRSEKPSVFALLKEKYPDDKELQMVHRLDMDTSGILVVAKTKAAHKNLQRQFAEHTIKKEYVAILSHSTNETEGVITLPLCPDYTDRPRQIVDYTHGKEAITEYKVTTKDDQKEQTEIHLFPLTGRTHQLRVHCAHKDGLNNPIKGDRLYGNKAERLYLHATYLEFTHPATGERMKFRCAPDW